jgi:UMF1 family MFS transporter
MTDTAPAATLADRTVPRSQVFAWGLWDWGSAAFNAVITTFVFTVYLTSTPAFGTTAKVTADLGWWLAGAGLVVALLAPIMGQRSDGSGRRKLWLGINTGVVVILSALMFFVEPKAELLMLGLFLIAAGTVFFEFAAVNYNAMLSQVSTPRTIGKISGFGWSMGYFGGIVLLLILYFGFIHPDVGLFGVTDKNGLSVRVSMVIAAAWFALSHGTASDSSAPTSSWGRTSRSCGGAAARRYCSSSRARSSATASPGCSPSVGCLPRGPSGSPPATSSSSPSPRTSWPASRP